MRNLLFGLLAALVLGSGAAFAQTGAWVGLSGGYPGAALHFGVEDIVTDGLDVRVNVGYAYAGADGASFGADALYGLDVDTGEVPVNMYVGGGAGLVFGKAVAVKALVGGEYRLGDIGIEELGVFLEVGPSLGFDIDGDDATDEGGFGFDARLGVNYHFDF